MFHWHGDTFDLPKDAVLHAGTPRTAHQIFTIGKSILAMQCHPEVRARDLEPSEVSAVFDTDSAAGKKGHLYGLNIPAGKKFLHKNTLCGGEDTHWMAAYADGRSLRIAFFSGAKAPLFTLDAISNSTSLCGTFSYTR